MDQVKEQTFLATMQQFLLQMMKEKQNKGNAEQHYSKDGGFVGS